MALPTTSSIQGYLSKPDGDGPFPAVVYLHGCSGLGPAARKRFSDLMTQWGYVLLAAAASLLAASRRPATGRCPIAWPTAFFTEGADRPVFVDSYCTSQSCPPATRARSCLRPRAVFSLSPARNYLPAIRKPDCSEHEARLGSGLLRAVLSRGARCRIYRSFPSSTANESPWRDHRRAASSR